MFGFYQIGHVFPYIEAYEQAIDENPEASFLHRKDPQVKESRDKHLLFVYN